MLKVRVMFGDLRYLTIFVETKTETMNKLRQLLFDFTNVGEWRIVMWVKNIAWKIKDYDRLENDYSVVIGHATCSKMSKTNYDIDTVFAVIDDEQAKVHYSTIQYDILAMVDLGADLEEVVNYIKGLPIND